MNFNYRFIHNNINIIAISIVVVVLHLFLVFSIKKEYSFKIKVEEQKPPHYLIQTILSANLRDSCTYDKRSFQSQLKEKAQSFGLNIAINAYEVGRIDDLALKKLVLTSTKITDPEIIVITDGLVLEYNGSCYGLI